MILFGVEMNWMMRSALGAMSLATIVTQANAADLAARPYTKAPPMIAAVYDWSVTGGTIVAGWGTQSITVQWAGGPDSPDGRTASNSNTLPAVSDPVRMMEISSPVGKRSTRSSLIAV